MPFHAHEVLEASWKAAPEPERELWQGLAQLAVGLTHVLRGNPKGATTLLGRARRRIALYADDPPYGIDAPGLVAWSDTLLAQLASSERARRRCRCRPCAGRAASPQATTRNVASVGSAAYAIRVPARAAACRPATASAVIRSPGASTGTPGG